MAAWPRLGAKEAEEGYRARHPDSRSRALFRISQFPPFLMLEESVQFGSWKESYHSL